jgi:protein gp37
MAEQTKIPWCDATFSPWEGCTKVSPGCAHCYAETRNKRFNNGRNWGYGAPRIRRSESYWKQPLKWNQQAAKTVDRIKADIGNASEYNDIDYHRPRIFCASLCDWLDDEVPIALLADLLRLIHMTRNLDWLLLSKRLQNFLPRMKAVIQHIKGEDSIQLACSICNWISHHPWSNIWLGTTVDDQQRADERIPLLLSIPAKVRFLSCEPLLEALDIEGALSRGGAPNTTADSHGIDWLICGGESGPNARPMQPEWARSLRDQCGAANVPFFFKQRGAWWDANISRTNDLHDELDGKQHHEFP